MGKGIWRHEILITGLKRNPRGPPRLVSGLKIPAIENLGATKVGLFFRDAQAENPSGGGAGGKSARQEELRMYCLITRVFRTLSTR